MLAYCCEACGTTVPRWRGNVDIHVCRPPKPRFFVVRVTDFRDTIVFKFRAARAWKATRRREVTIVRKGIVIKVDGHHYGWGDRMITGSVVWYAQLLFSRATRI